MGPGGVQTVPDDGLIGIRHIGDVSLFRAFVWNMGICRSDDKGETQVRTTSVRVPMQSTETESLVVAMKFL